jgi:hypothetical protein
MFITGMFTTKFLKQTVMKTKVIVLSQQLKEEVKILYQDKFALNVNRLEKKEIKLMT